MKETDKALWTQLFQDKPIPSIAMEHLQTQLMAQIMANPVDFKEEIRLAARRKWGIGLAISLMVVGLAFGVFIWLERNIVFQWLDMLWVMLSRLSYFSNLQQMGARLLANLVFLRELETGVSLLWGVVSWPILALLSVLVIFRSTNQGYHEKSSI